MNIITVWSPKGGSGASVVATGLALTLARTPRDDIALVDLAGDQPAIFGMAADPQVGIGDVLNNSEVDITETIERTAVPTGPGVTMFPRGGPLLGADCGPLVGVLRERPGVSVVDVGCAINTDDGGEFSMFYDTELLAVVRGDYLALRRAVRSPVLPHARGVVLVAEQGRSLGASEVADVLDKPVLAQLPVRPAIARAVDAGVVTARLPEPLRRASQKVLDRLGFIDAPDPDDDAAVTP